MPAGSVGAEISQLTRRGPMRGPQRGKPMDRKQAIAVALSQARKGAFGRGAQRRAGR